MGMEESFIHGAEESHAPMHKSAAWPLTYPSFQSSIMPKMKTRYKPMEGTILRILILTVIL